MGIPSFYRHLVKKNPTLIKEKGTQKTAVLALDLNCAIYHCLAKLQKKTPYEVSRHAEFEETLIKSVITYIVKLRDHVQPTELLYVAVDGVVPMAKIRQQRMRRFKSVWVGAEEARIKGTVGGAGWDRNAITPGTAFMDLLSKRLRSWAAGQKKTIVSDVYETGEGEQKIMEYLRTHGYAAGTEIVVYGLDADLIVLCLWHHEQFGWSFRLLREDVEMKGGVKLNAFGEEQLLYFDIDQCGQIIKAKWNVSLRDYMGAMSFLGNDFVPHGLTLCIRDDGIDLLMEILQRLGRELVIAVDGGYQYDAAVLKLVIAAVAAEEEKHVQRGLVKKLKMNGYMSKEQVSDEEKALAIFNALPLTWKVERTIMGRTEEGWFLKKDWAASYYREFLWSADAGDAVKQWYFGIQWVLDYYTGTKAVDMYWYYPWYLPPLFRDISKQEFALAAGSTGPNHISPIAQLIMVLPIQSYRLLPSWARRLPFDRPEFYPEAWTFFSCGRRQLWECEPMIPMLPFEIVKKMTRQGNPVS
jgi:5'-3' exoribonuclease 4